MNARFAFITITLFIFTLFVKVQSVQSLIFEKNDLREDNGNKLKDSILSHTDSSKDKHTYISRLRPEEEHSAYFTIQNYTSYLLRNTTAYEMKLERYGDPDRILNRVFIDENTLFCGSLWDHTISHCIEFFQRGFHSEMMIESDTDIDIERDTGTKTNTVTNNDSRNNSNNPRLLKKKSPESFILFIEHYYEYSEYTRLVNLLNQEVRDKINSQLIGFIVGEALLDIRNIQDNDHAFFIMNRGSIFNIKKEFLSKHMEIHSSKEETSAYYIDAYVNYDLIDDYYDKAAAKYINIILAVVITIVIVNVFYFNRGLWRSIHDIGVEISNYILLCVVLIKTFMLLTFAIESIREHKSYPFRPCVKRNYYIMFYSNHVCELIMWGYSIWIARGFGRYYFLEKDMFCMVSLSLIPYIGLFLIDLAVEHHYLQIDDLVGSLNFQLTTVLFIKVILLFILFKHTIITMSSSRAGREPNIISFLRLSFIYVMLVTLGESLISFVFIVLDDNLYMNLWYLVSKNSWVVVLTCIRPFILNKKWFPIEPPPTPVVISMNYNEYKGTVSQSLYRKSLYKLMGLSGYGNERVPPSNSNILLNKFKVIEISRSSKSMTEDSDDSNSNEGGSENSTNPNQLPIVVLGPNMYDCKELRSQWKKKEMNRIRVSSVFKKKEQKQLMHREQSLKGNKETVEEAVKDVHVSVGMVEANDYTRIGAENILRSPKLEQQTQQEEVDTEELNENAFVLNEPNIKSDIKQEPIGKGSREKHQFNNPRFSLQPAINRSRFNEEDTVSSRLGNGFSKVSMETRTRNTERAERQERAIQRNSNQENIERRGSLLSRFFKLFSSEKRDTLRSSFQRHCLERMTIGYIIQDDRSEQKSTKGPLVSMKRTSINRDD